MTWRRPTQNAGARGRAAMQARGGGGGGGGALEEDGPGGRREGGVALRLAAKLAFVVFLLGQVLV